MHALKQPEAGDRPAASETGDEQCSAVRRPVPEYLTIATVLAPWGVRGELKVRIETDFPERFERLTRVYLGPEHLPFEFRGLRPHQTHGLLKLQGIDNPEDAGELRGMDVQVPVSEAVPLPQGHYYVYQIEGLAVWTVEGEFLGTVHEVLFPGANAIYLTRGPRGEVLIPKIEGVVQQVDLDAGRITVRLPRGLLD
jgi:16S rRNA processing protein RimM